MKSNIETRAIEIFSFWMTEIEWVNDSDILYSSTARKWPNTPKSGMDQQTTLVCWPCYLLTVLCACDATKQIHTKQIIYKCVIFDESDTLDTTFIYDWPLPLAKRQMKIHQTYIDYNCQLAKMTCFLAFAWIMFYNEWFAVIWSFSHTWLDSPFAQPHN